MEIVARERMEMKIPNVEMERKRADESYGSVDELLELYYGGKEASLDGTTMEVIAKENNYEGKKKKELVKRKGT